MWANLDISRVTHVSETATPPGVADIDRQIRGQTAATLAEKAERYLILIEGGPPSNYSALVAGPARLCRDGHTREACEREMREAIAFHLQGLAEEGEPIPDPSGPGVYVEASLG